MNIVLTGAPGYLGQHLLRALCDAKQVHTVVCPVRAADPNAAWNRISRGVPPNTQVHVTAVPCDLTSSASVATLQRALPSGGHAHCIIHAAALDGYNYSWEALYNANVTGTQHMLQLQRCCPTSKFLYTSTGATRLVRLESAGPSTAPHGLVTYYAQTKALAEQCVLAHKCGRATVYDIGYLFETTDDDADDWEVNDICEMVWKLCILLKAVFVLGGPKGTSMDMTTLATVAATIVLDATAQPTLSERISLQRPDPCHWDDIVVPAMKKFHPAIQSVGYVEWLVIMRRHYGSRKGARWLTRLFTEDFPEQVRTVFIPGTTLPFATPALTSDAVYRRLCGISRCNINL